MSGKGNIETWNTNMAETNTTSVEVKIKDLDIVKQDPPLEEVQEVNRETKEWKKALKEEVEKYSIETQIKTYLTWYEIPWICSNCSLQQLADNDGLTALTKEDILELEMLEWFKAKMYEIYPELLKVKESWWNIEQTVDWQETVNQETSIPAWAETVASSWAATEIVATIIPNSNETVVSSNEKLLKTRKITLKITKQVAPNLSEVDREIKAQVFENSNSKKLFIDSGIISWVTITDIPKNYSDEQLKDIIREWTTFLEGKEWLFDIRPIYKYGKNVTKETINNQLVEKSWEQAMEEFRKTWIIDIPNFCIQSDACMEALKKAWVVVDKEWRALIENTEVREKIYKYIKVLNFPNDLEHVDWKIPLNAQERIYKDYEFLEKDKSKWIENKDLIKVRYMSTIIEDINARWWKIEKVSWKYTISWGEWVDVYRNLLWKIKQDNNVIETAIVSWVFSNDLENIKIWEKGFLEKVLWESDIMVDGKAFRFDRLWKNEYREKVLDAIEVAEKKTTTDIIQLQRLALAKDILSDKNTVKNTKDGKANKYVRNLFNSVATYKNFEHVKAFINAHSWDTDLVWAWEDFMKKNRWNFLLLWVILMMFTKYKKWWITLLGTGLMWKSLIDFGKKSLWRPDKYEPEEETITQDEVQDTLGEEDLDYQLWFEQIAKQNVKGFEKWKTENMDPDMFFAITKKITSDRINIKIWDWVPLEKAATELKGKLTNLKDGKGKDVKVEDKDIKKYITLLKKNSQNNPKENKDEYTLDYLLEKQDIVNKEYVSDKITWVTAFDDEVNKILEKRYNEKTITDKKSYNTEKVERENIKHFLDTLENTNFLKTEDKKKMLLEADGLLIKSDIEKLLSVYETELIKKDELKEVVEKYTKNIKQITLSHEKVDLQKQITHLELLETKIELLNDLWLSKMYYEKLKEAIKLQDTITATSPNTTKIDKYNNKITIIKVKEFWKEIEKYSDLKDIEKWNKEYTKLELLVASNQEAKTELALFKTKLEEKTKEIVKVKIKEDKKDLEKNNKKINEILKEITKISSTLKAFEKVEEVEKIIKKIDIPQENNKEILKKYKGIKLNINTDLDNLKANYINKESDIKSNIKAVLKEYYLELKSLNLKLSNVEINISSKSINQDTFKKLKEVKDFIKDKEDFPELVKRVNSTAGVTLVVIKVEDIKKNVKKLEKDLKNALMTKTLSDPNVREFLKDYDIISIIDEIKNWNEQGIKNDLNGIENKTLEKVLLQLNLIFLAINDATIKAKLEKSLKKIKEIDNI